MLSSLNSPGKRILLQPWPLEYGGGHSCWRVVSGQWVDYLTLLFTLPRWDRHSTVPTDVIRVTDVNITIYKSNQLTVISTDSFKSNKLKPSQSFKFLWFTGNNGSISFGRIVLCVWKNILSYILFNNVLVFSKKHKHVLK